MIKRFLNFLNYNLLSERDRVLSEYDELTKYSFVKKIKIGESVNKQDINIFEISGNINKKIPAIKIICNIHGDEITGIYLWLMMCQEICYKYQNYLDDNKDDENLRIYNLLNNLKICIVPTMNPDNLLLKRTNINNIDLNRDFIIDDPSYKHQPETYALIELNKLYNFVLSLECHDGANLLCYPNHQSEHETIDNNIFEYICERYVSDNPNVKKYVYPYKFRKGYVMGSRWYPITGSQCDYCYYKFNLISILIEYSRIKSLSTYSIKKLYNEHKEASLNFLELGLNSCQIQVRYNRKKIVKVEILELNKEYYTKTDGYLAIYILPGKYTFKVKNRKKIIEIPTEKTIIF